MINNQKGFGIAGIVMVVAVLGLIGAAGWYVMEGQSKSDEKTASTTSPSDTKTNESAQQEPNEYDGWKTYEDAKWKFEIKQPADWTLTSRDLVNGGQDTREIIWKSPDFTSNTQSVVEDITAGAQLRVIANSTDMTDFSATALKGSEGYRETTVAGVNAVYYVGRGNTYTYSLIKNQVMYSLSLRTVENDSASEAKYTPVFEKFVKSLEIQ